MKKRRKEKEKEKEEGRKEEEAGAEEGEQELILWRRRKISGKAHIGRSCMKIGGRMP